MSARSQFPTCHSPNQRKTTQGWEVQKTRFGGFFVVSVVWVKSLSTINNCMKPYTYLIKHRPTGKVYYGFRGANKVDPHEDLWKNYFTSSKKVLNLIKETGIDSFDFEIRKVFDTKEEAILWETRVLRRCNVLHDDRWLNANIAGYIAPTEEVRRKMSIAQRNRVTSEETKQKLSAVQKGKPKKSKVYQSPEYRALMSKLKSGVNNPMYGKGCTPERAARISEAKKGKQVAHNKGKTMSEEQKAVRNAKRLATLAAKKNQIKL